MDFPIILGKKIAESAIDYETFITAIFQLGVFPNSCRLQSYGTQHCRSFDSRFASIHFKLKRNTRADIKEEIHFLVDW